MNLDTATGADPARDLDDPGLYVNRELGLLAFQRRVLEEAEDPGNPLLERVKFLAILGSNLDEFFMVRVAGLKQQVEAGVTEVSPDGRTPAQQLEAVRQEAAALMAAARACLEERLLPELAAAGIRVTEHRSLDGPARAALRSWFERTVFPVLTPLAFDPGRPFPHISNLSLNLAVLVRDLDGHERFARVKVPGTLPRLVPVHTNGERVFVWLEDVVGAHLETLFPGMHVVESHPFRVVRNADFEIQELEAADLLETVEEGVRRRRFGEVVRLTVRQGIADRVLRLLVHELEVDVQDVYRVHGVLGLSDLVQLATLDRPDLRDHVFVPAVPPGLLASAEDLDVFAAIRRADVLLHHPYDSFVPVVDFLRTAARDPDVLAIKMTLYRVGRNSPVVEALMDANLHGKQVAVLVELKARFDEESNIEWARALEKEGVHVVYGLPGLKTHAKVLLVVRRENGGIRRYVHLATGNYNAITAQLYTDLGYLTDDDDIGADVTDLFNYLTGYSAKTAYRRLLVAPINLRESLEARIVREIEHARAGRPARLIFKVNALVDRALIRLLYRASRAGVDVDLLVRGICCLRPGLPGVSDRIRVTSIVGRFLEHSRVFYFLNGGAEEVFLGSADLMPRNIFRRVEVLFPVTDPRHVAALRDEILAVYLADNLKARRMCPDGSYQRVRIPEGEAPMSAQAWLLRRRESARI
ncbi:MAG TPA: polyphosphate kinase 1 [Candidatus Polarisedimenticolaceae bacterium]|nr:polyphosphate kinase 1 [Candidatus Polarisedimenticolaceae bacterium]